MSPPVATAAAAGSDAKTQSLHVLRGAAAFCVLLYHASHYLLHLRGEGAALKLFGGFFGGYGVAVFFALSGYLMAQIVDRDPPGRFLIARVTRIYPLFLATVAGFAVAFWLAGDARGVNLWALSLAPVGPQGYFLTVEWTLLYELTYYVALALTGFLGAARWRPALVGVWTAAMLVAFSTGLSPPNDPPTLLGAMLASVVNLPFALGFLTPLALRRGLVAPRATAAASAALAVASFVAPDHWLRLLVGLSAALLVAALAAAPDLSGRRALAALGGRFGDASYAMYLCHVPTILLLNLWLPAATPPALVWAIWVGAATGLALLLGPLDVASHRRIKAALARARTARVTGFALAYVALFLSVAAGMEVDQRRRAAEARRARALATSVAPAALAGPVRAGIEAVEKRPDGSWSVGAYGVDLDRPSLGAHVALLDGGRVVDIAAARRFRAALARELGRPDLAGKRLGFRLEAPAGYRCGAGGLEAALILDDGRVYRLPAPELAAICR